MENKPKNIEYLDLKGVGQILGEMIFHIHEKITSGRIKDERKEELRIKTIYVKHIQRF